MKKEMLPNSFYKASITLTLKPDKDTTIATTATIKELQANKPDEHRCQNSQQNISILRLSTLIKWELNQGCKVGSTSEKQLL